MSSKTNKVKFGFLCMHNVLYSLYFCPTKRNWHSLCLAKYLFIHCLLEKKTKNSTCYEWMNVDGKYEVIFFFKSLKYL